jgi:hypothetical protein
MIEIKKPMSKCTECTSCTEIPPAPEIVPAPAPKRTTGGLRGIVTRLRRVRHIEIYAAVVVITVMVLIFFSSIGSGLTNKSAAAGANTGGAGITVPTHTDDERRLLGLLSKIDGIGTVDLLINDHGIVIVASGAKNLRVRNDIMKTVFTLYKNTALNIEILS